MMSKGNNKILFQIKKQETAFSVMEKIASVEKIQSIEQNCY